MPAYKDKAKDGNVRQIEKEIAAEQSRIKESEAILESVESTPQLERE